MPPSHIPPVAKPYVLPRGKINYSDDDDTISGTDKHFHNATCVRRTITTSNLLLKRNNITPHNLSEWAQQRGTWYNDGNSLINERDVFGHWMDEQEVDKACKTPPAFAIPDSVDLKSPPALLHAWVFPPLPTSSTSDIPDHSKDLVMGVLSIQVSNKADVVSLVTRTNCFSVSGVWWKRLLHECAAERQELWTKSWACSRGSSFEQLQWFLLP